MKKVTTKGTLLKTGEAADILHISAQTLRDWTEAKKITATTADSGHRTYYEADVKKLALSEQGITTYHALTWVVAVPANQEKYYYLHPETFLPASQPTITELPLNKYWNFVNGLESEPHTVVLKNTPTIILPTSEPYLVEVEEAGNQPLIAHTVTIVGLRPDELQPLLSEAVTATINHLTDNYTAKQTIVWVDKNGKQITG